MCRDYNGYHFGGSSFVYVNDSWLLQKLFVYHRFKLNSEKKKKKKSQYMVSHSKPVRIRQSGRTGIGGVTKYAPKMLVTEEEKCHKFEDDLNDHIQAHVTGFFHDDFFKIRTCALNVE